MANFSHLEGVKARQRHAEVSLLVNVRRACLHGGEHSQMCVPSRSAQWSNARTRWASTALREAVRVFDACSRPQPFILASRSAGWLAVVPPLPDLPVSALVGVNKT